jgi:hypothetical protein
MMHNYMIADIVGTMAAVAVFALLFVPPGFLLGWASNVLGFRGRSAAEKLLISVVLSAATTPIITVLVGRFGSMTAAIAVVLVLSLAAGALAIKELRWTGGLLSRISSTTWIGLGIMAVWLVLALLSVVDLQWGNRLYPTYAIFDHSVRIPFVQAAARTGVPPLNPFYGLGKPPVLRYYYYWYVVCALPVRLTGISARASFHASVVWSGFALAAILPLYLKHFLHETEALRRKSLVAISLLLVTGLDLIPYGVLFLSKRVVTGDMEWWDPNQVTSWLGSLIWVPHHVAALTACMAGLLVLSALDEQAGNRERTWAAVISGAAFASAAGLSIFVTLTFAVFAVLWTIILLVQRRFRDFVTCAAAGAFSLLLSLPYLLDLRTQSGAGQRFAVFAFRAFPLALEWLRQWGVHNAALLDFAKLPIFALVYLLEFGFFACVAILRFKRELLGVSPLTRQQRTAWVMLGCCLLVVSTLQSDTTFTAGNDLGFRGMLVVQFVLLLWAAPLVHDVFFDSEKRAHAHIAGPVWKTVLAGSLALGVLGTLCQLALLRSYAPLAAAGKIARTEPFLGVSPGMDKRAYRLREGLSQIEKVTTPGSLLQYNPASQNVWLIHLYSKLQAAAADSGCGAAFGGDVERCRQAMPYLEALFQSPAVSRSWDLDRLCDSFSVNVLVATDADPIWYDTGSWVWTRKTLLSNESLKAIPCGTAPPLHQAAR